MSSSTALAAAGVKAVGAGKYADGIEKLSEAIKERPAPLWLLERSKAYVRAGNIDLALHDAEEALSVAFERANRDYMVEAQIRRAVALFRMGRYADADVCAFWATRLIEKAKATEDDGQQKKVDGNGDYIVRADEVENEAKPDKSMGLATALGSGQRTKSTSLKNQALSWRLQALSQLEKLPVGHPGRKVTVTDKYPKPSELPPTSHTETAPTPTDSKSNASADIKTTLVRDEAASRNAVEKLWEHFCEMHAKKAIRSSFYQTDTTLTADIFVKNTDASRFSVTADEQKITTGEDPNIQLHLWGKIKPDETKYTVKPMKIELVLRKATPGKWPMLQRENAAPFSKLSTTGPTLDQFTSQLSLSGYENPDDLQLPGYEAGPDSWYSSLLEILQAGLDEPKASAAKELPKVPNPATETPSSARGANNATMQPKADPTSASKPAADPTPTSAQADSGKTGSAPAYPTSSKKGAVNWDKLEDEDDDEDAKDSDVNSFFQKLYKDADENTKRAMMKSYIESNGTSLSTNWDEAREKTYKTQPPDGADVKKWD